MPGKGGGGWQADIAEAQDADFLKVHGGSLPLMPALVGFKHRTNYTTAMHILLHNFRRTNFVDKREEEQDSGTLLLLYNELEE